MRVKALWLLVAAGIVMPRSLSAQALPLGDEFQVNTYTFYSQLGPAITSRGDRSFVVTWSSIKQDAGSGVFGQRFDEVGAKLGSEFPVNSYTTGDQGEPSVAISPAGDFVIVWTSDGQDGYGFGVVGQRFDGAAAKLGAELALSSATVGPQRRPQVAVDPTGSFVVVWESEEVHYIGAQNVTLGRSASQYCPGDAITRDAMASLIAKVVVAPGGGNAIPLFYDPDPATETSYSCVSGNPNIHFSDVPVTNPFCKHIHSLLAKGIVSGCTAKACCPTRPRHCLARPDGHLHRQGDCRCRRAGASGRPLASPTTAAREAFRDFPTSLRRTPSAATSTTWPRRT